MQTDPTLAYFTYSLLYLIITVVYKHGTIRLITSIIIAVFSLVYSSVLIDLMTLDISNSIQFFSYYCALYFIAAYLNEFELDPILTASGVWLSLEGTYFVSFGQIPSLASYLNYFAWLLIPSTIAIQLLKIKIKK